MYWVFLSIPAKMQQSDILATVVGPMTAAQFTAKYGNPDNTVNPAGGFKTRLQAQAAASKYNTNPGKAGGVAAPSVAQGIGNPLSGIAAIGDLANRLTQPNTWIRVGEFIAGTILVIIGLNAITKGPAREAATSTAKKGAKLGALIAK